MWLWIEPLKKSITKSPGSEESESERGDNGGHVAEHPDLIMPLPRGSTSTKWP